MKKLLTLAIISLTLAPSAHAGKLGVIKTVSKKFIKNGTSINQTRGQIELAMAKAAKWESTNSSSARIPFYDENGLKMLSVVKPRPSLPSTSYIDQRYLVQLNLENLDSAKRLKIQNLIDKNMDWIDQRQAYTDGGYRTNAVTTHHDLFSERGNLPRIIEIEVIRGNHAYMSSIAQVLEEIKYIASSNAVLTRKAVRSTRSGATR